jgi:YVTN family beta-propeller protein
MIGNEDWQTVRRLRDNVGRVKVSQGQNVYDADFEYGSQPLRWESFTNTGTTLANGVTYVASNDSFYVANRAANSVSVYSNSGPTFVTTIGVGAAPRYAALAPSVASRGDRVFVTNENGLSVSVIQCSTNTVIGTIVLPGNPWGVAYSTTQDAIYVTGLNNASVWVINPTTLTLTTTISIPVSWGIAYSPVNNTMYVSTNGSTVVPVPCSTNVPGTAITVGSSAQGVAYNPTNQSIYVTNNGSGNVSVINPSTNLVTATVTVGSQPRGICYDPTTTNMYVANLAGSSISVIAQATNTVTATITTNVSSLPWGIAASTNRVLVAYEYSTYLGRINPSTNVVDVTTVSPPAPSITHLPGEGGVRMRLTASSGDVTIRQSRPYHRYQPGKTMFMATAAWFGPNQANQVQRVGFFDDSNGAFFEQGPTVDSLNPSGMCVVLRSDAQPGLSIGLPTDARIPLNEWSDPANIKNSIDWNKIQMLWIEYAWYGAGLIRWGVFINGEPYTLHELGSGNQKPSYSSNEKPATGATTTTVTVANANWITNQWTQRFFTYTVAGTSYTARIVSNTNDTLTLQATDSTSAPSQTPVGLTSYAITVLPQNTKAWARTGNLPVRYEQRNIAGSTANDMIHFGVSVLVEGGTNDQRGFTYAYGSPWNATSANAGRRSVVAGSGTNGNRIPVVSIRGRTMGTQEYTQASAAITSGTTSTLVASSATWTVNQWAGRYVNYGTPSAGMLPNIARIVSNTATTLNLVDNITGGTVTAPAASQSYTIGQINRGQLLPRRLQITSDRAVFVELVTSTPSSAVNLTGASFAANSVAANSFALIDNSATAFTTSGEVVYSIFVPANSPVDQQIDNLFPLLTNIRGTATDILTVLVTNTDTTNAANVSVQIIGQEAMS